MPHDKTITKLSAHAQEWRSLPLTEKVAFLDTMIVALQDLEAEGHIAISNDSLRCQLMEPKEQAVESAVEALISISVIKGQLSRLRSTLFTLNKSGKAPAPVATRSRASEDGDEQIIAKVFPLNIADKCGPQGKWTCELWLQPNKLATQGTHLMTSMKSPLVSRGDGCCCVVLGAGNQGFLTIVDALDILFVQNETVLVKHHPLRGYQDAFMRTLFKPLLDRGFFDVVKDTSVEESTALVSHENVAHIHMTGGKPTHDAIMWGMDGLSEQRKERNEPKVAAHITSELGCVTPWIVVPALFTDTELMHQASQLAAALNANSSCNCNSPKVVLVSQAWKQRTRFISEVKKALCEMPITPPYYPGETARYNQFQKAYHPNQTTALIPNSDVVKRVRVKGSESIADLPFLAIDIEMEANGSCDNNYALRNEAFCPVVAFVTINGIPDTPSFLKTAPLICNEHIFGTLSCTVVLHPSVEKKWENECETFFAHLKYGTICVNAWSALGYAIDTGSWGAYPGEDPRDIESGIGFVRNTLMFDHVQKSVVRSPLVDQGHVLHKLKSPLDKKENVMNVVRFILRPGVGTFCRIVLPSWCCSTAFCTLLTTSIVVGVAVSVLVSQGTLPG